MKALIVLAHPSPTSFSHAMADAAKQALEADGHSVTVSDLYADGFDAVGGPIDFLDVSDPDAFHYQSEQRHASMTGSYVPEISREQQRVVDADALIFVYPIWWGGMPAILKGWFDRVLSYGFAYEDGMRYETGYLHSRAGLIGLTTGGTKARFTEGAAYGNIEQVLWPTQHCMIEYLGLRTLEPFVAYAAPRVSDEERAGYLAQWVDRVRELVTLAPTGAGAPLGPPPGVPRPTTWVTS